MSDNFSQNLISAQAADKLLSAHDGDLALLYLYIRRTGSMDMDKAAGALCRTLREMEAAEEKLRRMGLLDEEIPVQKEEKLPPAVEVPQYTAQDIAARAKEDEQFAVIVSEAAKVMGHILSSADLKILFGIYDYLSLPTEVILVLLNYCSELFYEKYQESRRPTAKFIEKEAYHWERLEILSLEQAEEHIKNEKIRRSGVGRIKNLLGIHGRELSASERDTFATWAEMGFEDEAISLAYDRTTERTGGFRLKYMNSILENWHKANTHSLSEIEAKEGRRTPVTVTNDGSGKSIDKSILDRI